MTNKKGQHAASPEINTQANIISLQTLCEQVYPLLTRPQRRVLRALSNGVELNTAQLRTICSVGNISDIVARIQHKINPLNLKIINHQPSCKFINQFGEPSPMHVWRLVQVKQEGFLGFIGASSGHFQKNSGGQND